jgi:hypothetical protein
VCAVKNKRYFNDDSEKELLTSTQAKSTGFGVGLSRHSPEQRQGWCRRRSPAFFLSICLLEVESESESKVVSLGEKFAENSSFWLLRTTEMVSFFLMLWRCSEFFGVFFNCRGMFLANFQCVGHKNGNVMALFLRASKQTSSLPRADSTHGSIPLSWL